MFKKPIVVMIVGFLVGFVFRGSAKGKELATKMPITKDQK